MVCGRLQHAAPGKCRRLRTKPDIDSPARQNNKAESAIVPCTISKFLLTLGQDMFDRDLRSGGFASRPPARMNFSFHRLSAATRGCGPKDGGC